jgi:hypothetical protein
MDQREEPLMTPYDPPPPVVGQSNPTATDLDGLFGRAGLEDRLWIRTIAAILQIAPVDPLPNPRVQFAFDRLQVAACERAVRILSSDVASSA